MSEFALSFLAQADITEIWKYYATIVLDVEVADKIRSDIFKGIRKISKTPGLGHLRRDLADELVRFWRVNNYLIIYQAEADSIYIVRVLHGSQNIKAIMAGK